MTTLITNISCSSYNVVETLSTLRFGNRAKSIQNKVVKNEERSAQEIKILWKRAEKELKAQKELVKKLLAEQNGDMKAEATSAGAASARASALAKSKREQGLEEKVEELTEAIDALRKDIEQKDLEVEELSHVLKEREVEVASATAETEKKIQALEEDHAEALREQRQARDSLQMQCDEMGEVTEKLRYENEELKRAYEVKEKLAKRGPEAAVDIVGAGDSSGQTTVLVRDEKGHSAVNSATSVDTASNDAGQVGGEVLSLELQNKIGTLESDLLNRCQKVVELEMSLDRERDYINRLEQELKSNDGEPFSAMTLGMSTHRHLGTLRALAPCSVAVVASTLPYDATLTLVLCLNAPNLCLCSSFAAKYAAAAKAGEPWAASPQASRKLCDRTSV